MPTTKEGKEERIRAAIEKMGGAKALVEGFEAFHQNMCELDSRTAELREEYPHHWVALLDGEILTHPGTQLDLLELVDGKGWDREVMAIRYMDPEPVKFIL